MPLEPLQLALRFKYYQRLRAKFFTLSDQQTKKFLAIIAPREHRHKQVWRNKKQKTIHDKCAWCAMFVWRGHFGEWLAKGPMVAGHVNEPIASCLHHVRMDGAFSLEKAKENLGPPSNYYLDAVYKHWEWLDTDAPGWRVVARNNTHYIKFLERDHAIMYRLTF